MSEMSPAKFLDRRSPPHLGTLIAITALSAMTLNLFLPSLPAMAVHFGVDYALMTLSVSAYLAMSAVLQLILGPLSDRYGRRKVILGALVVFLVATLGTILATDIVTFMVFRLIQAVVVAGMALSRAVARDMVDGPQAASLMGYITMFMAVVPMVAPFVGGLVEEAVGWRGNFVILLVTGAAVLGLSWADLGETHHPKHVSLLSQVREYPELFTSQRFWGYVLVNTFTTGVFFAYLGGAPFVANDHFHLSPSIMGIYFGASALGYVIGNFLSGRYSVRVGVNPMVMLGVLAMAGGLGALALMMLATDVPPIVYFGMFIFCGLGNGLVIPNATSGMLSVRPHLAGTASGLGGAIMVAGGAGLATLAGVLMVPGAGPWPLVLIMLASNACALVSILWVIRRARQVGA